MKTALLLCIFFSAFTQCASHHKQQVPPKPLVGNESEHTQKSFDILDSLDNETLNPEERIRRIKRATQQAILSHIAATGAPTPGQLDFLRGYAIAIERQRDRLNNDPDSSLPFQFD
jgi:hypothetical protein